MTIDGRSVAGSQATADDALQASTDIRTDVGMDDTRNTHVTVAERRDSIEAGGEPVDEKTYDCGAELVILRVIARRGKRWITLRRD